MANSALNAFLCEKYHISLSPNPANLRLFLQQQSRDYLQAWVKNIIFLSPNPAQDVENSLKSNIGLNWNLKKKPAFFVSYLSLIK